MAVRPIWPFIVLAAGGCIAPIDVRPSATPVPAPSATTVPSTTSSTSLPSTDEPVSSPSDAPVPQASGREVLVTIPSQFGDLRVRIDSNGLVVAGRAATTSEIDAADIGQSFIAVRNLTERELLIAWVGSICDRSARLIMIPTEVFLAADPRQPCDTLGYGWGLVATTREAVDGGRMIAHEAPTSLLP